LLPAFQQWLAELQDGHTWVWEPVGNLPYAVRVDETATFVRVPEGTDAYSVGVRPGWLLQAIDEVPVDATGWLARAAAPPHSRALIAGRRLLAGPVGAARALTAISPNGERATWTEQPTALPARELVTWCRLASGAGYVRVAAWTAGRGVEDELDAALTELAGSDVVVFDLRANPGGNLVLAAGTRDRFLRGRTVLGSIRYSIGGGEISDHVPIVGEPSERVRWGGRLVVLTDQLTFSSSEDFLLGLQGLEHVRVVGRPTGGGSGRARALRLLAGMTLTVSTALTYDRDGHCVEGAGIPVDVTAGGSDADVLAVAETL
jgi:carboxyl-terminal processing protease